MSAKKAAPGPWAVGIVAKQTCYVVDGNSNWVIQCHDGEDSDAEATAKLVSAAPDLLAAQTMGVEMNTPDFIDWVADRLVHVYGENPNVDFVRSLRERAEAGRAAITKATGAAK